MADDKQVERRADVDGGKACLAFQSVDLVPILCDQAACALESRLVSTVSVGAMT